MLSEQKIKACLEPMIANEITIQFHHTLSSTNDLLLNQIKSLPPWSFIFSECQTAGRGRRNKTWDSIKNGNLYFSFNYHFKKNKCIQNLSLVIAMALCEALQKLNIAQGIKIKWPNDLYLKDKKISGILIETRPYNEVTICAVIGVGLNLISPENISCAGGLFHTEKELIDRHIIIGELIASLHNAFTNYAKYGFNQTFQRWPAYDFLKNKKIKIDGTTNLVTGVAQGVSKQGELILLAQNGELLFYRCGEVSIII